MLDSSYVAPTDKIQRVAEELSKKAESLSSTAEIHENKKLPESVESRLSQLRERCKMIYSHMDKASTVPVYGDLLWRNYKAALEAHPWTMQHDKDLKFVIGPAFVSQIDPAQVSDPGPSDDEAEDLAAEPVEAGEDSEHELSQDLEELASADENSSQDIMETGPDDEIDNEETVQQRDFEVDEANKKGLEHEQVFGDDVEDPDMANEDLKGEDAAERGFNEDPDGEVTLEIRDGRRGRTQQKLLKVTITLEY